MINWTNNSVLITGGTGFIGSHIARRLVNEGKKVHIFARDVSSFWRIEDILPNLAICYGDLTNYHSILHCLDKSQPDAIIHLGGGSFGRPWSTDFKEIDASIETNLQGTLSLLKAVEEVHLPLQRFIRVGGLLEYGNGPIPFDESQREQPASVYPAIQVATTMILNAIHRYLSFPVLTLRLSSVYGPGRSFDFFIPSLIKHCLEGRDFNMTSGEQLWDMVYIDDAVNACLKAICTEIGSGEVINIGSGQGYKLREIAELIKNLIGGSTHLKIGALPDEKGGISHLICKIQKAKRLLNWEPHTKLEDGLKTTIEWYRDNINIEY